MAERKRKVSVQVSTIIASEAKRRLDDFLKTRSVESREIHQPDGLAAILLLINLPWIPVIGLKRDNKSKTPRRPSEISRNA